MNTFWIHDGKKITIVGTLMISLSVIAILVTKNTFEAAFFGIMITIYVIVTIKAASGWSYVRRWEKQH